MNLNLETRLFSNVKYVISGEISEEVKLLLCQNGAERYSFISDYVTHCIAGSNPDEGDVNEAVELYGIPAVTQEWVTYSYNCQKLLPTSAFKGCCKLLFTGVVVSCSKVPERDVKKLWALVKYYGGRFSSRLKKTTTHLIVGRAEGEKYRHALKLTGAVEVVTPDWLVDSIRADKPLDTQPYHPQLLLDKTPTTSGLTRSAEPRRVVPLESDTKYDHNKHPSLKAKQGPFNNQILYADSKMGKSFISKVEKSQKIQNKNQEAPPSSVYSRVIVTSVSEESQEILYEKSSFSQQLIRRHSCCKRTYPRLDVIRNVKLRR